MLRHPSLLRLALAADAAASGAVGLLLALGGSVLAPWLGLPSGLLSWAGIGLIAFAALVAWTAMRQPTPAGAARLIVVVNAAWVVASLILLVVPPSPVTPLGVAFVLVQAAAVLALSILQRIGLGRMHGAATRPA